MGSLLIFACKKSNNTAIIPNLEFKNTVLIKKLDNTTDSVLVVNFKYSDGDGDVGLATSQTEYPFGFGDPLFYNLFVNYYVNNGSGFTKVVNPLSPTKDTINFNERLESITPSGKHKSVSGDFSLFIPANPFGVNPKQVQLDIQLVDRAAHFSNKIKTQVISITL